MTGCQRMSTGLIEARLTKAHRSRGSLNGSRIKLLSTQPQYTSTTQASHQLDSTSASASLTCHTLTVS